MSFTGRGKSQPRGRVCPDCQQQYGTAGSGQVSAFLCQLKRSQDAGTTVTLTWKQWWQARKDFRFMCVYCGRRSGTVIEHVLPLDQGGGMCIDNIVPACFWCNRRKGGLLLDQTLFTPETKARIGRYLDYKRQGKSLRYGQYEEKWWLQYGKVAFFSSTQARIVLGSTGSVITRD